MANRPVFVVSTRKPYVYTVDVEFQWNGGLNIKQRQKNVVALHEGYLRKRPKEKVLEISSKSLQPEGVSLSAFNLKKRLLSVEKEIAVEKLYQGSKVFVNGGPYIDIYEMPDKISRKDERLKTSGLLVSFVCDGVTYPTKPEDAFYNWLYISALIENPELSSCLLEYDAFTDIAYNPKTNVSCQAKAAAIFAALSRTGNLEVVRDFKTFVENVYH